MTLDVDTIGRQQRLLGADSRRAGENLQRIQPISIMSNWAVANSAPGTSDNSGATVVNPEGITRTACKVVHVANRGTTLLIAMIYPAADTITVDPVIQAFGFSHLGPIAQSEIADVPTRLVDASDVHELTIATSANDATFDNNGTSYKVTSPVEVDMQASRYVLVAVKTAVTGTSSGQLIVKPK